MLRFLEKSQLYVVFFMLLITPFLNIYEVISFINGTLMGHGEIASDALFLRVLKDLLIGIVLLLGIFVVIESGKIYSNASYYFLIGSIIFSAAISFTLSGSLLQILSGIRWLLPFLIIPFMRNISNLKVQQKNAYILLFLFSIQFILQIVQKFYFKVSYFGTAVTGFFIIPSTASFFCLYVWWYFNYFTSVTKFKRTIMNFFLFLSVLMTGSGTGFLAIFGVVFVKFLSRVKEKLAVLMIVILFGFFIAIILIPNLPYLLDRPDFFESPLARVGFFQEYFSISKFLFSWDFGKATNTANQFGVPGAIIADSMYLALLYNIGIISTILFLFFISKVGNKNTVFYQFIFINLFFCISTIITESFPMNILFAISIAYFINTKQIKTKS
ncbi:MAG: hypothetical protein K2Q03_09960 [Sphingobacteriaceae bacterium]|nr:hypothetical protein [Sphingobacteriaceae bacterium]